MIAVNAVDINHYAVEVNGRLACEIVGWADGWRVTPHELLSVKLPEGGSQYAPLKAVIVDRLMNHNGRFFKDAPAVVQPKVLWVVQTTHGRGKRAKVRKVIFTNREAARKEVRHFKAQEIPVEMYQRAV